MRWKSSSPTTRRWDTRVQSGGSGLADAKAAPIRAETAVLRLIDGLEDLPRRTQRTRRKPKSFDIKDAKEKNRAKSRSCSSAGGRTEAFRTSRLPVHSAERPS